MAFLRPPYRADSERNFCVFEATIPWGKGLDRTAGKQSERDRVREIPEFPKTRHDSKMTEHRGRSVGKCLRKGCKSDFKNGSKWNLFGGEGGCSVFCRCVVIWEAFYILFSRCDLHLFGRSAALDCYGCHASPPGPFRTMPQPMRKLIHMRVHYWLAHDGGS